MRNHTDNHVYANHAGNHSDNNSRRGGGVGEVLGAGCISENYGVRRRPRPRQINKLAELSSRDSFAVCSFLCFDVAAPRISRCGLWDTAYVNERNFQRSLPGSKICPCSGRRHCFRCRTLMRNHAENQACADAIISSQRRGWRGPGGWLHKKLRCGGAPGCDQHEVDGVFTLAQMFYAAIRGDAEMLFAAGDSFVDDKHSNL